MSFAANGGRASSLRDLAVMGVRCSPTPRQPGRDVLLVESTYGDASTRPTMERNGWRRSSEYGGRGREDHHPRLRDRRVEELLYWIKRLEEERRIPVLPVYLDSPMALDALKFYSARYRRAGLPTCAPARTRSPRSRRGVQEVHTPQQSNP